MELAPQMKLMTTDEMRAEMARQVWRSPQLQLAIRSILQGGKRTSRAELEEEFKSMVKMVMQREEQDGVSVTTSTADPMAGQPCNVPLESLKSIRIGDLVPGRRHAGDVLWVENVGGEHGNHTSNPTPILALTLHLTLPNPEINPKPNPNPDPEPNPDLEPPQPSQDIYKVQGATALVADQSGGCTVLSLYNYFDDTATSRQCQERLPKGTVIGIKGE